MTEKEDAVNEVLTEIRDRDAGISMLDVHWDGDPQIHLVKRTNLATEYPVGGERVVTIGISDDWYPIAANKALEADDGGWTGDYGPNEVEWSAESVEEAVDTAFRAFDHDE
jgi:hypothetical protein